MWRWNFFRLTVDKRVVDEPDDDDDGDNGEFGLDGPAKGDAGENMLSEIIAVVHILVDCSVPYSSL